ncbi:hypothetical protein BZG02_12425 [Labilibaculum filiforme]|uniref:Uncharacterized protein n=1 Tax=Labilibaculum filiforme TaxID=1940526 RepID=A0A2N3HWV2_9BACT|nr:hypothetical protein [Labilibaculum filiforme]PKQ62522.1 hypothetical protein BZG02_12425 [Labilibaculum filiforme]
MHTPKQTFLHNEFWLLTFGGAFQHVSIYKKDVGELERKEFRVSLKKYITDEIIPQYVDLVTESDHVENLKRIILFSKSFKDILVNGKLNVGVSQKLLNLILKYYWCLGEIAMPPHCPVDRIIQVKGLKTTPISWTTISDTEVYLNIITKMRKEAESKNQTLAEWELEVFQRNGN